MTANDGRPGRPGLPVDLLADLHAGVLPEVQAAQLRRQVAADPRAQEVLAALDATVAELRAVPAPPIPDSVSTRLDAALTAERPPAPVVPLATRRRMVWGGAALVAAVAALLALVAGPIEFIGTPQPSAAPLALTARDLGDGLDEALGASDYGPLSRPGALQACLDAHGAAGEPLGAREVTVNGRPGVLLVLPVGEIGRFRLLVVGADCGPGTPALIADDVVGS